MERNFGQHFSRNVNCFNVINNSYANPTTATDILKWISPLESWKRHHDISTNRVKGVGDWVLGTAEYQAWLHGRDPGLAHRTLFCPGIPGAGKTFVCSLVVDTLCDGAAGPNAGIACLYCDYREKGQVPVSMIGSLLRQFVAGLLRIPEEFAKAFQTSKGQLGGRALKLERILEMLPRVLALFRETFICIDALDEFPVEHRAEFLRCLKHIAEKSPNTRFLLTGRWYILSELDKYFPRPEGILNIQPSPGDITIYLTDQMNHDPTPDAMDDHLRWEIMEKIPKGHSDVFLLVNLHIATILREVTTAERRQKLYQMTDGLRGAYGVTMERIRQQRGPRAGLGLAALMWISMAERPLLVDELCHALAVETGSMDIDRGRIPSIETILGCCLGLVIVDRETATVRLIHATLQEYFRTYPDLFHRPHVIIAEACLTYLNFPSIRNLSTAHTSAPPKFPLVGYASCCWGIHARKELTARMGNLALGILLQFPEHIAATLFILNERDIGGCGRSSAGFTGLHYAASFGLHELVLEVLAMTNYKPAERDPWGRTPLIWAAKNGHATFLKALFEIGGFDPNIADLYGSTPLTWGARYGHEGVIEVLLAQPDVKTDLSDSYRQTPLSWAAEKGHEGAVKMLLNRADVNPNSSDWRGRTPLSWAAEKGREGVVKLLLDQHDVNPNSGDVMNRTPLIRAAKFGHEGVVKLLLNRPDIDPNFADNVRQTPLSWAAAAGQEGAVKTLLSRPDVSPNLPDLDSQTPISWAAEKGHEGVVKLLLGYPNVNPNLADDNGQTPLSWAAATGHEGVVRILSTRADVDPYPLDNTGRGPLSLAFERGHIGVVDILLAWLQAIRRAPRGSFDIPRSPRPYASRELISGI